MVVFFGGCGAGVGLTFGGLPLPPLSALVSSSSLSGSISLSSL